MNPVPQAPICQFCGVTALPTEDGRTDVFRCENPDCELFGDDV